MTFLLNRAAEIRAQLKSVPDENARRIESSILALDAQQSIKGHDKRSCPDYSREQMPGPSTLQLVVDVATGLSRFSKVQVDEMRLKIQKNYCVYNYIIIYTPFVCTTV